MQQQQQHNWCRQHWITRLHANSACSAVLEPQLPEGLTTACRESATWVLSVGSLGGSQNRISSRGSKYYFLKLLQPAFCFLASLGWYCEMRRITTEAGRSGRLSGTSRQRQFCESADLTAAPPAVMLSSQTKTRSPQKLVCTLNLFPLYSFTSPAPYLSRAEQGLWDWDHVVFHPAVGHWSWDLWWSTWQARQPVFCKKSPKCHCTLNLNTNYFAKVNNHFMFRTLQM